ncbi:MAG: hypothetical protein II861_04480 [Methanomicrobium sp.]|nr:hypothetical protein [Methanomicrobium sp.]
MSAHMDGISRRGLLIPAVILALVLMIQSAGAAGTVSTYAGNTVELSGSATGSDYVYLFVIGPNLPSGGVSLEDLSQPAISGDTSTFLRLPVKNNRWSYKWRTTESGRILDNGNYIVYIVNKPKNRHDLSQAEYSYINVRIMAPTLTAYTDTGDKTEVTATLKPTGTTQSQTVTQTTAPTQVQTLIPTPAPTQAATPVNTPEVSPSPQAAADSESGSNGDSSYLIIIGAIAAVIVVIAVAVYAYSENEKKKRYRF